MIHTYVVLIRAINVGGKNKVPMAELKKYLEQDCHNVQTYIQSGNVVLQSPLAADVLAAKITKLLAANFTLDGAEAKVVVIEAKVFESIVADAPSGFGSDPETYRYYVLFPMDVSATEVMQQTAVRPNVDAAWQGRQVVYYRLPSIKNPLATKSHLNKVIQKPIYKSITMRNWATTTKIAEILKNYTH